MRTWTYEHSFLVTNHDGDTIKVNIDRGLGDWLINQEVRLRGVACNELKDPGGPEARDATASWAPVGSELTIVSFNWDKFGRLLGDVYKSGAPWSLNQWLIDNGWAVAWNGTGKQPKVPFPPVAKGRG